MQYYNVEELRKNLREHVLGLGIDKRFLENPAFASAISEIDSLIGRMYIFQAAETLTVKEENGNISFEWTPSFGDKYSMSISSSSPETFRCVYTEERKPYVGRNGQTIREKYVVEKVATIDNSGFITLTTNGAMVNNIDCSMGKCNNSTWAEKEYYTADGVMRDREYKSFSGGELTEDFDRTRIDSILYIPRQAFNSSFWENKYESRTLLVRDKLDTARIVVEDRRKGIRYNAITQLYQEYGLKNMVPVAGYGYDPYPKEVIINPLSQEEIEAMIKRESNPKIAEGLRQYAVGRESYSYNSAEDSHFVREGLSEGKSK